MKQRKNKMDNIYSVEYQLNKMNEYTDVLTAYTNELYKRSNKNKLNNFAEMRKFSREIIDDCGIFYIGSEAEMLLPSYLDKVGELGVISNTNNKPIFSNRYVIPIKNMQGKILGLVGYSKEAAERYIYCTSKYYRRRETMWGLENLELAWDMGYAIVTEGITDAIRIRSQGHPNTFAMCGTHKSDFIMKQLNRCKNGVIKIPDRDAPGRKASARWECNRSITLNTFIQYKDADEMCRDSDEMKELFEEYLSDCINWILSGEHKGFKCENIAVTIGS